MEIPETPKMLQGSRKRAHSVDTNTPSKKLRKSSKFVDAHEKHGNDGLKNLQAQKYVPHQSIGLMYRVNVSILCSLRISRHKHKYSTLTIAFEDARLRDIVVHYNEFDANKSLHVQVEDTHTSNRDNFISYVELFGRRRRSNLNQRFNSFFKFAISESKDSANVEYLIIYSSLELNLTSHGRLEKLQCKNFYPFKFDRIDLEECEVLKDIFFTDGEGKKDAKGKFYRFSRDKQTREELLGQLKLNQPMQDLITKKKVSPAFELQIKNEFLNKLVIASEMPGREELRTLIEEEIERKELDDYTSLKQRVLSDLGTPKKRKNAQNLISGIIYEFDLLTSLQHTMFCHEKLLSIKIQGRSQNSSNDFLVHYKNKFTLIRPVLSKRINYKHLFPSKDKQTHAFSINDCFASFLQKLEIDVKFFIIFTNAHLNLRGQNELVKKPSIGFVPLKFEKIDVERRKYKIFKHCGFFNKNELYQFSKEEVTQKKILSLLKFPNFLESENCTEENKEKFLGKLIFAVDQANESELKEIVKSAIRRDDELYKLPYNYEEINEVTIRSLKFRRFKGITKKSMKKILKKDVKMNRSR